MWKLVLMACIGPGMEIEADCGYRSGDQWVSLVTPLILEGIEDAKEAASIGRKPEYVFRDMRSKSLAGASHILSFDDIRKAKLKRPGDGGKLPVIEWSEIEVPIRK